MHSTTLTLPSSCFYTPAQRLSLVGSVALQTLFMTMNQLTTEQVSS